MPIVRIDPPDDERKKTDPGHVVRDVGRVIADPISGIAHALSHWTGGNMEERHSFHTVPLEIDTTAGTVTALLSQTKNAHDNHRQQRRGDLAAPILERIYRTGNLEKVPSGYREVARAVQKLSFDSPWTPEEPDYSVFEGVADRQPRAQTDSEPQEDYFMGGFLPPGGLAGFSQMMPASKIALTRGGRGRSSGVRRRRKRVAKGRPRRKIGRARNVGRPRKKAKARAKRGRAKLVKGSAAAKRYMASIRRKRK